MLALAASLGSSIISPANKTIAKYVGISSEVAVLSISLYNLGFAFGPPLLGANIRNMGEKMVHVAGNVLPGVIVHWHCHEPERTICLHNPILLGVSLGQPQSAI